MKNEISSLEMYYLVKEFKVLEGSKVDRIYHAKENPKEMILGCHVTGQGKSFLRVMLPGIIFLDDMKESSGTPTGFGMMLRKYLEGARVKSIEQKDFERVITIMLENRIGEEIANYFLIIELFSKGNVIFCDGEFKIMNILEEQVWKDRALKRNETYKYPKSRIDITKTDEAGFKEQLKTSDKESLVKSLAIIFNLGGIYAEELCHASRIDKNSSAKDLSDKEYNTLYKNAILLLHEEISANACDGNIFPFKLGSYEGKECRPYAGFSDAIRENYDIIKHVESKKGSLKEAEKLMGIIDEQSKRLSECEDGYRENQAKGEIIYERYQEINAIIETVKEARKKHSWSAIKQKLDDNPEFKKILKDIDEKSNSIILEIEGHGKKGQ